MAFLDFIRSPSDPNFRLHPHLKDILDSEKSPSKIVRYKDVKNASNWYTENRGTFTKSVKGWPSRAEEAKATSAYSFSVIDKFPDADKTEEVAMAAKDVVIFKADNSTKDPYEAVLTGEADINSVEIVPVISFSFINADDLYEKLKRPENYAGIVFTSPRYEGKSNKNATFFV